MAYISGKQFSTFQGRGPNGSYDALSFRRRMRMPVATLALGLLAALAIAAGALDTLVARVQSDGLSQIEFLTGELPIGD
ncbi:MAG: hypothetical protein KJ731_12710 [Alphaproteobacteria bacterium]|nr:hypothetical protein [Alphaproteobacteria bacterium]MBU1280470.1 hypothetical protein [Alphaproteobacteria bacterium]MBU1572246.1 hypothetical protein [Alphaproteobacteria bacterium]MBU1829315.1 hypothetical protein [Alphaproteobacteria bacterium]MBU2078448.1 hypothetical protein [Alphaproteobacteria bacterium]